MKATITIRLDERQHKALARAAKTLGKSASEIVRDALDQALSEATIGSRAGHLKGTIRLRPDAKAGWRTALRARNWRS